MITIDASVLVAADAADEDAHAVAQAFLGRVLAARSAVHLPALAIVEVTAAIARRTGDASHAREVGFAVRHLPGVVLHDLGVDEALISAGLASDLRLRSADAVYAAVALANGTMLVTLDAELAARAASLVPTCTPTEWVGTTGEWHAHGRNDE